MGDDSHLDGSGGKPPGFDLLISSIHWGDVSVMLICWWYLTVAILQSGQHPAETTVRMTLVCLICGFIPFYIQATSAMGKWPLKPEMQWDSGTVLPLPGSSGGALPLTWPPLLLKGGRFCSQYVKLQELGAPSSWLPCFDTDFLHDLGPITWFLPVSVSYGNIKTSLTSRMWSLLSMRG